MVKRISPAAFEDWLNGDKEFALVDTRDEESFEAWHMPGAVNFPFGASDDLDADGLADLQSLVDGADRLVTVCAKGISSVNFAEELEATDAFDTVYVVNGGMSGWSDVYHVAEVDLGEAVEVQVAEAEDADEPEFEDEPGGRWGQPDPSVEVVQLQRRAKGCLGYLVGCPETGEAAVVDATRHLDEFRRVAMTRGYDIVRVFDTHVHADHLSGGRELASKLGVPYHLGARASERDVDYEFEALDRNEVVSVGDVDVKALFTPGHTTESVSYLVDGVAVLTGDTLFVDSTGRTELEFGDEGAEAGARMQFDSLHGTLLALPDDVCVLPGHATVTAEGVWENGAPGDAVATTVGDLRTGLDVLGRDEGGFVAYLTTHLPEKPPNYERVIRANRGVESVADDEATELELGPNNCAAK